MSTVEEFEEAFIHEHRAMRDSLLYLMQAFRNRDLPSVRCFLTRAAALSGPHFRYVEESLYPALAAIFGAEQFHGLMANHARAIDAVQELTRLAGLEQLTEQDAQSGANCAKSLLAHLSECNGVSLMAELLPEGALERVLMARQRSQAANLDLVRWAEAARSRA